MYAKLVRRVLTCSASLREVLRMMWSDATGFVKARLACALLLAITASVLTALGPIALKGVVDAFTGEAKGIAVSPFIFIGLFVSSLWLARIAAEIRGWVYASAERRMLRRLCERLFSHVMHLPLRFHLERQTGALSQTLENGLQGYQMILHHLVFTVIPIAAELGTTIVVLSHLAQPLFLALFGSALVCYAAAFAYAAVTTARAAKTAAAARVESSATMTDGILNLETVKYFAAESTIQAKLSAALARTETEWVYFYRRYALNGLGVATIFAVFLVATMLYAAHEVAGRRMTVGLFVLISTYMMQLLRPLEALGYAVQGFSQGVAMLDSMLTVFQQVPELYLFDGGGVVRDAGDLEFKNVSLAYRPERAVLKGVSFRVAPGQTLGIVGASGSGKSTIVRLLARLFEPDEGEILLDGILLSKLSLIALRQSIAVVPQDTVLFNDTIGYNISFGRSGSTREDIERAAKLARLHDFIVSLPEGYETRVGERGVKLSGGERQRVSIARAVLKQPCMFVFDEATSSLDSRAERDILANLQEVSRSHTTLVIAHRLSTVVHANEIVVLERGSVVERGTHESLLRERGRYAALWDAQQHNPMAA